MINSVAEARQQARKALIVQLVALFASSVVMLLAASPAHALAAALGGGALIVGAMLAAWVALGGQTPAPAMAALGRLLTGMMLKWLVLIAVLFVGVAVLRLPPLGLSIGVVVVLLAQLVSMARR